MAVNDTSDPEIVTLLARIEEYRRLYDFGTRTFNRDEVLDLYKKDDDFHAYDVAPPTAGYPTWQTYSEVCWYGVMDKYSEIHFEYVSDVRVIRRGDVAWSNVATLWYGKTQAGVDFSKDVRVTLVWVKDDGKWTITHEHASSPVLQALQSGEKV